MDLEEIKRGYFLWENPITKEIEILSSRQERDRKEKTYTMFADTVEEITSHSFKIK